MIRFAPLLLLLVGCAPAQSSAPAKPAPEVDGECALAPLKKLVGRKASPALGVEAQRLSGTRTVRWIAPGQAVTMDYSPGRLNIQTDEKQNVIGFDCG